MPLKTHYLTCLSVVNQFSNDPLCKAIVKDRGGYSQIIFRKREKEIGLDLVGFDWYVNAGGFGLSIQKPFDALFAMNTFKVLFSRGITVLDSEGFEYFSKWHDTIWGNSPAGQIKFEDMDKRTDFSQIEIGEHQRAYFRAFMFAEFIRMTLPVVRMLVASKIATKLEVQPA